MKKYFNKKSISRLYISHVVLLSVVTIVFAVFFMFSIRYLITPYYYDELDQLVYEEFDKKELILVSAIIGNDDAQVENVINSKNFLHKASSKKIYYHLLDNYSKYGLINNCSNGEIKVFSWGQVCRSSGEHIIELPVKSADNTLAYLIIYVHPDILEWEPFVIIWRGVLIFICVLIVVASILIMVFYFCYANPTKTLVGRISSDPSKVDYGYLKQRLPIDECFQLAVQLEKHHLFAAKNAHLIAIGQSASTIAHDVRRPLAAIKGLLSSLPAIKDDPEQIDKMVARVDRSIVETNAMLDDILDFSKDASSLDISKVNPQGLIISSLSSVFRGYAKLSISIDYDLNHRSYLKVDAYRIGRVINNIIGNAIEAMNKKGRLWVKTQDLSDNKMKLTLGNDGPIIPEDILDKMFEPFFTKGKKNGTGLGLSICQKIIEMHGGSIDVASACDEVGTQKTEFVITLPAEDGNLKVNEAELIHHTDELRLFREEEAVREEYGDSSNIVEFMKLHKAHGKAFNLLIVDDEPLFRETIKNLINTVHQAKDHIKILETDSAKEALDLFETQEIGYLIADIDLGAELINGYQLSKTVLKKYPGTNVIIHSNKRRQDFDREIRAINSPKFLGFLSKPMKQSELIQFLAQKSFEAKKQGERVKKKKVLVLNDDDALLMTFKIMLKSSGVDVLEAMDVEGALEHFKQHKIDIILSDINLGDGQPSGYDFLKKVRQDNQEVPFYMVSGYSQKEEEPKARKQGANGYLQLPIDKEQLDRIIS